VTHKNKQHKDYTDCTAQLATQGKKKEGEREGERSQQTKQKRKNKLKSQDLGVCP
jgi:hypothetical protein